jgi:exopolysaccharide biosynthesis polyprenyl glycosylphosphotransferase
MKRDRPLEPAILLQDISVLGVSMLIAWALRSRLFGIVPGLQETASLEIWLQLALIFVPTWALCAERLSLWRLRTLTGPVTDLVRAMLWTQALGTVAIAVTVTIGRLHVNRSLLALFLLVSTGLLLLLKSGQRAWLRARNAKAVAVVLGGEEAEGTAAEIAGHLGRRIERLPLDADALKARLMAGGVDEVVLPARLPRERQRLLLSVCEEVGVPALVETDRLELDMVRPRAEVIGPTLYLAYQRREPHPAALLTKALLDRVVALLALLALAPVMLAVAMAVAATLGSPVFFVQRRGGLNGHPFPMIKFRTMRPGAEMERDELLESNEQEGPVFKMAKDPRVTRLGRILRRTSLDELPQLFNVLAGQMSLAGPRPLPIREAEQHHGAARRRLSMKPGLTCLWQVNGRSTLSFAEWMRLDLEYVDRWSLTLDFAILLRTIPAVISGRGAW